MNCYDNHLPFEETWVQREYFHPAISMMLGGFSPKSYHDLALKQPPHTQIKYLTNQRALKPWDGASQHIWGYHTWVDVGRLPPVFPTRPDKPYDSNVWRWVTRADEHKCPSSKAPIPPPSWLGKNTFLHYIENHPIFEDPAKKGKAITKCEKEIKESEILKARSKARVPPLDAQGNIIPPENFKRYRHVTAGGRLDPNGLQLVPNSLPNLLCRGWACPNPQPHYKETMSLRLLLHPAPPLHPEMVRNFQILAKDRGSAPVCYVTEDVCLR